MAVVDSHTRDLPVDHPGHGLVTRRQFDRRRENGLLPRPVARRRRHGAYGTEVSYPPITRNQLRRLLQFETSGIRGETSLRLALWLDGFDVDCMRLADDLAGVAQDFARLRNLRGPRNDDLAADRLVLEMMGSRNPNPLIQFASQDISDRDDLAAGLLNILQLMMGTPPKDLELNAVSAEPLARLLQILWPPLVVDPASVGELLASDHDVARYLEEFGRLPAWSTEAWVRGRDDALLMFRSGTLPPLPPFPNGMMWLAMRISCVAGSIALRNLNAESWDSQTAILRAREGVAT